MNDTLFSDELIWVHNIHKSPTSKHFVTTPVETTTKTQKSACCDIGRWITVEGAGKKLCSEWVEKKSAVNRYRVCDWLKKTDLYTSCEWREEIDGSSKNVLTTCHIFIYLYLGVKPYTKTLPSMWMCVSSLIGWNKQTAVSIVKGWGDWCTL